ncbi:MAG: aminotransferase class I/II-fold pyridoxal phosphate-dependent enzyme [Trueperaceae bacterium]
MKLKPFRIEHYYAPYEFTAKYMLSSSDAQSRSIRELLELEPGAYEQFLEQWCGYTEAAGAHYLREAIANIYSTITSEDVLVMAAAEEGIFVLYHALADSGDHIIVETPCYESSLELAKSTGAEVSEWKRHYEENWQHDIRALEKLIRPNTKIIAFNSPNNPTGLQMKRDIFEHIVALAKSKNIIVFCDEVYRELEHDPSLRLPALCDIYENGVSLGSMSKTYGLAGLRPGWLVTKNREMLEKFLAFKYYTSICNSAPSEFLSALALRNRDLLIKRNLEIVHKNLPLLEAFLAQHDHMFEWVKPNASPIGFPRVTVKDTLKFCEDVVAKTSVLLLPGTVYDQPQHIRMGFGRENMPEALEKLESYLATL